MGRASYSLELVQRFVAGEFDPEVLNPLRSGFETFLLCGGELSLERCLDLPNTPFQVNLALRDIWIRHAASKMKAESSYAAAMALANELFQFVTRGRWRHLKDSREPPEGLTPLNVCLFHIVRLNDGDTLSGKQIHRVIGHKFPKKCPTEAPTMERTETTPGDRQEEDRC